MQKSLSFAIRDRYQPWVDRQLRHRRLPPVLAWSRLSNSHGPANVNPILQSLRQGVRRTRLSRAAPRPQSAPTSYPSPSAATGAHRNSPNDDTQSVHTLRCDASHRGRARPAPMRTARLERAPLHTPARHRRRHPTLRQAPTLTSAGTTGKHAPPSQTPLLCPSAPARPPSRSHRTSSSRSPMA